MNIREFGEALITTGDLDPVYIVLHHAGFSKDKMRRYLFAYWCFYHMGAAAHISEGWGDEYWDLMLLAAENIAPAPNGGRWPRASERRYFRGLKCVQAVRHFRNEEPHGGWVGSLEKFNRQTEIMEHVKKEWPLFGPWIGFKIADMMERVYHQPVNFSQDIGLMYSEPRASLEIQAGMEGKPPETIYKQLMTHFGRIKAPPGLDRGCGPQEVETILCKWKSHHNGKYKVGKDIAEVRHALEGGWGRTADKLLTIAKRELANV